MLAHTASHEGIIAAENACGKEKLMNYDSVPSVFFTTPEIASVGLSSQEAQNEGHKIISSKYPLSALGKAKADMTTEGFVKIIADWETKQILGAQIIGKDASTMISEMSLAITNELTLECILDTIHPHPTLSEAWLEVAALANKTPLNFLL